MLPIVIVILNQNNFELVDINLQIFLLFSSFFLSQARVMYDFNGESAGELCIKEDEILNIIRQDVGDGWWEAENSQGVRGLVPQAYCEVSIFLLHVIYSTPNWSPSVFPLMCKVQPAEDIGMSDLKSRIGWCWESLRMNTLLFQKVTVSNIKTYRYDPPFHDTMA